jgi:hypothetical protein
MATKLGVLGCLTLLGAAFAAMPAMAQPAGPVRLAILDASFAADRLRAGGDPRYDAFFGELARLGHREGENLEVMRLSGVGLAEADWATLVGQALAWDPHVIFATPSRMALQLKALTTEVPVVFVGGAPVRGGVVDNVARPGGNITGLSQQAAGAPAFRGSRGIAFRGPGACGLVGRAVWRILPRDGRDHRHRDRAPCGGRCGQ